ncbi:MAG: hypothetical protein OXH09_07410 [Gammaproteobacteria bacterium]|nr:hypothetical protein [Gammaproteobacteria bacterium]
MPNTILDSGWAVLRFFQSERLNPPLLRTVSQTQLARLAKGIDALDVDPKVLSWDRDLPLERRGGFLALNTPGAGQLAARLRSRDVFTDHRGTILRLGPAPYVTNAQLDEAVGLLGEAEETAPFNRGWRIAGPGRAAETQSLRNIAPFKQVPSCGRWRSFRDQVQRDRGGRHRPVDEHRPFHWPRRFRQIALHSPQVCAGSRYRAQCSVGIGSANDPQPRQTDRRNHP